MARKRQANALKSKAEHNTDTGACQGIVPIDAGKAIKKAQEDEKVMSPEKMAFVRWLATPRIERVPKTQQEFAKSIGVTPETVSRWKSERAVVLETFALVRATGWDRMAGILGAVAKKAEEGNTEAARLFLSWYTGWSERALIALQADARGDALLDMGGSGDPFAEEPLRPEELPTWAQAEIREEEARK